MTQGQDGVPAGGGCPPLLGGSGRRWFELTTLRCGLGRVVLLEPCRLSELQQMVSACQRQGCVPRRLGGGSNTVGSDLDSGIPVIRLGGCGELADVQLLPDGEVVAGAGARLAVVLRQAARFGLGGLSGLSGIPGSLGGAVAMNAGANGQEIGPAVRALAGIDLASGRAWRWSAEAGGWDYRRSPVPPDVLLTEVRLRLQAVEAAAEKGLFQAEMCRRRQATPAGASAGSVFMNPAPGCPAGRLLESCGCKELRCGVLEVSQKHANWIVNRAGAAAAAADARTLVGMMRDRVRAGTGIELQCEWRWM